jgi:hypothetical protein
VNSTGARATISSTKAGSKRTVWPSTLQPASLEMPDGLVVQELDADLDRMRIAPRWMRGDTLLVQRFGRACRD